MKSRKIGVLFALAFTSALHASTCTTSTLPTYQNSGNPFSCSESSNITIGFNQNLLPSYVGLNLLSLHNSSADPATITVTPGTASLNFTSPNFSETGLLLSSQAELVQFMVAAGSGMDLTSTTFSLANAQTSTGGLGLGTGLAIGQELVCLGGAFTSLPTGLVTSVANGLLGTGNFGCNGAVLVGTAAVSSGPLNAITGTLDLPNLTNVTNTATIQFAPYSPLVIDVIKIQALITVANGTASTNGFGDSFTSASTPEPGGMTLAFSGVILMGIRFFKRRFMRHSSQRIF